MLSVASIEAVSAVLGSGGPILDHTAILIEVEGVAVDILLLVALLLSVVVEVEPEGIAAVAVAASHGVGVDRQLNPAVLSGTIVPAAEVVVSINPGIVAGLDGVAVLVDPAIEHLAVLIEGILLAVDGLEIGDSHLLVVISVGLSVRAEVEPSVLRAAVVVGSKGNPLVADHRAVRVDIVVVIAVLDQLIGSHASVGIEIEPVISGLSPCIGNSAAVVIEILPSSGGVVPASCEGHSGGTKSE